MHLLVDHHRLIVILLFIVIAAPPATSFLVPPPPDYDKNTNTNTHNNNDNIQCLSLSSQPPQPQPLPQLLPLAATLISWWQWWQCIMICCGKFSSGQPLHMDMANLCIMFHSRSLGGTLSTCTWRSHNIDHYNSCHGISGSCSWSIH